MMNGSYFEDFASVYDLMTENVDYEARAEFINKLLKAENINSGILLDLACGTGTMTAIFADYGYDIIGVDYSDYMLSVAREKYSDRNILFLCQDMRELDLYGTVKVCVCSLDSINHLTVEEDVQRVFDRVSLFTEPGGVFIFDVNTVYKHREVLADNCFVYETENCFLTWQNELEKDGLTVDVFLDIFSENEDGLYERGTEEFSEKAYPIEALEKMLIASGFDEIKVFGDLKFTEPESDEERIYIVAKKR